MCGGTGRGNLPVVCRTGLSPRVRGNQPQPETPQPQHGSIPACAGEPLAGLALVVAAKVYPRVCGGTRRNRGPNEWYDGLSPRVRGNHRLGLNGRKPRRSIPACAGEPRPPRSSSRATRVYPRVCGGTALLHAERVFRGGSIPACAGEPLQYEVGLNRSTVYPRVCGGTMLAADIRYP